MKATGIVRKIDHLGRVVLPIELRRVLDIDKDSALEIYVENDSIILRKYEPACIFCKSTQNVKPYLERNICCDCRRQIGSLDE